MTDIVGFFWLVGTVANGSDHTIFWWAVLIVVAFLVYCRATVKY